MFKHIINQILPPIIYRGLKTLFVTKEEPVEYFPAWHIIKSGNLQGREMYLKPEVGFWQKDMYEGVHDDYFYRYLNNYNINGKLVLEIGAHVGYHALNFSQMVGKEGLVYAFEPNIFNQERFKLNLTKNEDLSKRIRLFEQAVSDSVGEIEFNFSSNVDDGTSSGSYITGSNTPLKETDYQNVGFEKVQAKTTSIDQIFGRSVSKGPFLIKIDVEGAEHLVLKGGIETITKFKPILLIEVHSIFNMLKLCEIFPKITYQIELLKEELDGRCFIAARPENEDI